MPCPYNDGGPPAFTGAGTITFCPTCIRCQLKFGLSSLSFAAVVLKRRASSFNESPGPTVISVVFAGAWVVGDSACVGVGAGLVNAAGTIIF